MTDKTGADLIAATLKARGVERVFALCGGHIMPIWMALDAAGIEIVDVRDERAAVYMAHAHAAVGGGFGVALVTAGPGVTNAMTGIANAHVSRMRSQPRWGMAESRGLASSTSPSTYNARCCPRCCSESNRSPAVRGPAHGRLTTTSTLRPG